MTYFGPVMDEKHLNMVCRNTRHPSEFCYREEITVLIGCRN